MAARLVGARRWVALIEQLLAVVDVDLPPSLTADDDSSGRPQHEEGTDSNGASVDDFLLLPPEERVLTLLDEYGGRMWQQDVVDETGYSAGRVSEVLSGMESDDQVTRYWKSGKKVVTLPDSCPELSR